MDARVTARFWRVSPPDQGVDDFPAILKELAALPKAADREKDLTDGITVRLEKLAEDGEFIDGELCRVQMINIPPKAGPDGLEPIDLEGKGLGHVGAFRYHKPTRVLLLQQNHQGVTVNRLAIYLAATQANRIFKFAPILASDAMKRFIDKKPRSFEVTFAGPENLNALDDQGIPAAKGAKLIAEAYQGVRVKIQVSVGRSRKLSLNKDDIMTALGKLIDADGVKSLKVKAEKNGDDDFINFLKEQMQEEKVLALPEGDHEKNYTMRKLFLVSAFSDNMGQLKAQFGQKA